MFISIAYKLKLHYRPSRRKKQRNPANSKNFRKFCFKSGCIFVELLIDYTGLNGLGVIHTSGASYRKTKFACYLGYVTQAISINLLPLLYVTFQKEFEVSLAQLGLLVTVLFVVQIVVDLLAARYGQKLPYRAGSVVAFALAAAGLVLICVLPSFMDPYYGILVASLLFSIGGGLIEVLISPMVDAMPQDSKAGEMSLLHSFYCWGVVAVILLSTVFFVVVGVEYWRWLVLLWSVVPALTAVLFLFVPIPPKPEASMVHTVKPTSFLRSGLFWLLMALMVFSGAAEMAPAQWASYFAEHGLHIPKTIGDLLGPCAFAVFQGISRVVFSQMARKTEPRRLLLWHAVGCVVGYVLIVFVPHPLVSLLGFCLCGWCIGPMWPGVLSLSSERYPTGGTSMFAALALCGDVGCSVAPLMVGAITDALSVTDCSPSAAMRGGFAVCMIFPLLLVLGLRLLRPRKVTE